MVTIRNIITILLLFISSSIYAQSNSFATVSIYPREGVIGQPFKVTISAYSSTWFAEPLSFSNLTVQNAFIIPFSRTVSSMSYIDGKKYATLTFYYLIYPYETGDITIPALELSTSIPPEGGYKGEAVTIKTKRESIEVTSIPSKSDVQIVANRIRLSEKWSSKTDTVKVGDIIDRKISIYAEGTLPSFITPIEIEDLGFTNIYHKSTNSKDKRSSDRANGLREDSYSYLFTEEGEFSIPEEELLWWHPNKKQVYKTNLPAKKIVVIPNPNLTMLASLEDSLKRESVYSSDDEIDSAKTRWEDALLYLVVALATIYAIRISIRIFSSLRTVYTNYLTSELYRFRVAISALRGGNRDKFIREIYIWFDIIQGNNVLSEDRKVGAIFSDQELTTFENIIKIKFKILSTEASKDSYRDLISELKQYRRTVVRRGVK